MIKRYPLVERMFNAGADRDWFRRGFAAPPRPARNFDRRRVFQKYGDHRSKLGSTRQPVFANPNIVDSWRRFPLAIATPRIDPHTPAGR